MSNTVTARDLFQLVNAGYQPVTQLNEEFGVYSHRPPGLKSGGLTLASAP